MDSIADFPCVRKGTTSFGFILLPFPTRLASRRVSQVAVSKGGVAGHDE